MTNPAQELLQITPQYNLLAPSPGWDNLEQWRDLYFEVEVTTAASSQKMQQRDIA